MIVISAPFGNWFKFEGCVRTYGTYTLKPRSGRWWRVLTTMWYYPWQRSWINKIGLRNPGIRNRPDIGPIDILSIHGFDRYEWNDIVLGSILPRNVEFNLSCPNVRTRPSVDDVEQAIRWAIGRGCNVICKLPPVRWMDWANPLFDIGVRSFHACNTIATPAGGISGKPLKQYSIWATQEIKDKYGGKVTVIGGGGVTCEQDVVDYKSAGADHVAIATMLCNPFNWRKIPRLRELA